jgi:hypothetical protein
MQSEQDISPDAQVTYLVADNDESGMLLKLKQSVTISDSFIWKLGHD